MRRCVILAAVPYPDKLLAEDEEVVRHLHPHWLTLFWPVVWFLVIVGAASFGMAVVPAGRQQGVLRMLVLGARAASCCSIVVLVPLLRWRTTHYVITTHRLLFREGILARRGRDLGLSRITDVSYRQTLWDRIINSGTLTIESAGESGATVLKQIPDSDGVQQLLNHMVEEDADRRAQESAGYLGEHYGPVQCPYGDAPTPGARRLGDDPGARPDTDSWDHGPTDPGAHRTGPSRRAWTGSVGSPDLPSGACACCTPPTGTSAGRCTAPICSPSRRRCSAGWPRSSSRESVDVVLVAGDVYDRAVPVGRRDRRARPRRRRGCRRAGAAGRPDARQPRLRPPAGHLLRAARRRRAARPRRDRRGSTSRSCWPTSTARSPSTACRSWSRRWPGTSSA